MMLVIGTVLGSVTAWASNLDDFDVSKEFDTASFVAGFDVQVGTLEYVVDRTTGLCFAIVIGSDEGLGLTTVDCERLKKAPSIKRYLETGQTP